jgi:hypothetical protein
MTRVVLKVLAVLLVGLVFWIVVFFALLQSVFEPSRDEVHALLSPDGSHIAKLIEVNGGATTSFVYVVTLASAATPSDAVEVATLYDAVRSESASGANLRWVGTRELAVEYLSAKSSKLVRPAVDFSHVNISVTLRSGLTDPTAPAGGMLYNLQRERQ